MSERGTSIGTGAGGGGNTGNVGMPKNRGGVNRSGGSKPGMGGGFGGSGTGNSKAGTLLMSMRAARVASASVVTAETARDRKSTRLNSSHQIISYAVFCLKK